MSRLRNPENAYRIGRILHWVTAIVFIVMLVSTDILIEVASNSAERRELFYWHESFGVAFLYLLFFRFGWVLVYPETRTEFHNRWQAFAARSNHYFLYTLMILVPTSGFISALADGDTIPLFKLFTMQGGEWIVNEDLGYYLEELHLWLRLACYVLLGAHVLGAVSHWLMNKKKS